MAARNVADGVSHGQHRQAKGQRHAGKADAKAGEGRSQHGAAATAQYQPERAEKFGAILFHDYSFTLSKKRTQGTTSQTAH
ncbi:hypothetical protein D3C81_1345440 [compost metagenome]